MGPIATGLGEVYMWTVHLEHRDEDTHRPGEPGIQPDGSYITPEGDRLVTEADKATYLRTAQDWIVATVAGSSVLTRRSILPPSSPASTTPWAS